MRTADGSHTIFNSEIGESYHSKHGAFQESIHVFLNNGLKHFLLTTPSSHVAILEVGLGTGLNFLLSANYCLENKIKLDYIGIEAFPLNSTLISQTGYDAYVSPCIWQSYIENYSQSLLKKIALNNYCTLTTAQVSLFDFKSDQRFDIIYFDAFAAVHQPEMWSDTALQHASQFLNPGGIFVTYAITGNLKRSFKSFGFDIEKIPGALGKREMFRATRFQ